MSRTAKAKLAHLSKEDEELVKFMLADAVETACHLFSKSLRDLDDHTLMILADNRYVHPEFQSRFPKWLSNHLPADNDDLSVDEAIQKSLTYFKTINRGGTALREFTHA